MTYYMIGSPRKLCSDNFVLLEMILTHLFQDQILVILLWYQKTWREEWRWVYH